MDINTNIKISLCNHYKIFDYDNIDDNIYFIRNGGYIKLITEYDNFTNCVHIYSDYCFFTILLNDKSLSSELISFIDSELLLTNHFEDTFYIHLFELGINLIHTDHTRLLYRMWVIKQIIK